MQVWKRWINQWDAYDLGVLMKSAMEIETPVVNRGIEWHK